MGQMTPETAQIIAERRSAKAIKLAAVMREQNISAETARTLVGDNEFWAIAAKAAHVDEPSPATRQIAIKFLEALRDDVDTARTN